MKGKKLMDYGSDELEINIPLIASELDTDPNRLRYLSNKDKDLEFGESERIVKMFNDVKENGNEITSINDNTTLYEYGDDSIIIILYETLDLNLIIVDTEDVKVIKRRVKELIDL